MKLQILIPHYDEEWSVIESMLDSIALQQSVDFREVGVIIAHDGNAKKDSFSLPWQWSKEYDEHQHEWGLHAFEDGKCYPFRVELVDTGKHVGVSAARNAALDHATADYVMFCDADDMFCDIRGLYIIMREIKTGFDTLISCFVEETRNPLDKSEPLYINHETDSTFVHGKIHRREYLIKNNIRFNDNLTVHEDSFFNILTRELAPEGGAKYCPMPFYLWRWRDASVCRHDPDYILKTYNNMIDSNDALVDEFVKHMRDDKANFYVGFMIMDAYYTMNKPEWIDKTHKDYRDAVEKRFKKYYEKHRGQFEKLTDQEKMQISTGVRQRSAMEGMLMEAITLDQWLERISK